MILSNSLEIWFVIIFLILITLFMFFFYMARKKRKMLVQSGNYITNYYNKHPDERKLEYVPSKNKPLNQKKSNIFLASSYALILEGTRTKKIKYNDIYWVYGLVAKNSKRNKHNYDADGLVIYTIKGKKTIFLRNQEPYVKFFHSLGIPSGYGMNVKEEALRRKKELKSREKK